MEFEFTNTQLFGTDGEQIEVMEPLHHTSPENAYIECIDIADDYGIILQHITTEFLGEDCEITICPMTGDLELKILNY
jgi:hypothetical protein